MSIADEMGIKYPIQNDTPWILTTDFMLSVNQNGKLVEIARTVKETKDLEKQSVAENFELERRYYIAKGIDWGIVTEKHIPRLLAENVGWVHPDDWLEATAVSIDYFFSEIYGIGFHKIMAIVQYHPFKLHPLTLA